MTYIDRLKSSFEKSGSILCMGIDPVPEYIPEIKDDPSEGIRAFFGTLLNRMVQRGASPAAFKPNLGFFSSLDRPREGRFGGSEALSSVLDMLESLFPGIPVILDYKRGDISRSSYNYAQEGFEAWKADAVTVSPYMGTDSVEPFLKKAGERAGGVYILNRTSNPGGSEFQNVYICKDEKPLFSLVAERILSMSEMYPGTGAVTGATSVEELGNLCGYYGKGTVPLLIPGVGSQGGSMEDVVRILSDTGYDASIVRVNVSSGITHPWVKENTPVPGRWADVCMDRFFYYRDAAAEVIG